MISGKKLAVIPVLRAGLGMVNSILTLVPSAKVGHVGPVSYTHLLVYEGYEGNSSKLEMCMELVRNAVNGGHKILLFSQFTTCLLYTSWMSYQRFAGQLGGKAEFPCGLAGVSDLSLIHI